MSASQLSTIVLLHRHIVYLTHQLVIFLGHGIRIITVFLLTVLHFLHHLKHNILKFDAGILYQKAILAQDSQHQSLVQREVLEALLDLRYFTAEHSIQFLASYGEVAVIAPYLLAGHPLERWDDHFLVILENIIIVVRGRLLVVIRAIIITVALVVVVCKSSAALAAAAR